jgi:hypothetical protein
MEGNHGLHETMAEPGSRAVMSRNHRPPGRRYTDVSATVLSRMLAKREFLVVNVHIPYEGEIAGTDLALPVREALT